MYDPRGQLSTNPNVRLRDVSARTTNVIANQNGGTAKTTIAAALSAVLSLAGAAKHFFVPGTDVPVRTTAIYTRMANVARPTSGTTSSEDVSGAARILVLTTARFHDLRDLVTPADATRVP
jgi:hypothetical protein